MMFDFGVRNEGTLALFWAITPAAREWLEQNVQITEETQWWGGALVVEHRYAGDLLRGILDYGFRVTTS